MALTGPEKAVLMLLSLDEAAAAPIVAELDDADMKKLREIASLMRAVPANALDEVYGEFISRAHTAVAVPKGGVGYLKRLANRALGEARTQAIFSGAAESAIDKISRVEPATLAGILEREHPQLVAAILSQLEHNRAATVLKLLPEERQSAVLSWLANMTEVPAGLLEGVASAVVAELPPADTDASVSVDGVSTAAGILRKVDKQVAQALLERLEEEGSDAAEQIKRALHTFEDLKALDPKGLRTLLKEVPQDRLVLALKTASQEMRDKIFNNMSTRAAELLRDDLDAMGGVRLSDVESAQREIVEIALRLEVEGVIQLGEQNDLV